MPGRGVHSARASSSLAAPEGGQVYLYGIPGSQMRKTDAFCRKSPPRKRTGLNILPCAKTTAMSMCFEDPSISACREGRKTATKLLRFRKKLSKILHTHAALIILSALVVMDAVCVIGQVLADIYIVQDKLQDTERKRDGLEDKLQAIFPKILNGTEDLTLEEMLDRLREELRQTNLTEHARGARHLPKQPPRDVGGILGPGDNSSVLFNQTATTLNFQGDIGALLEQLSNYRERMRRLAKFAADSKREKSTRNESAPKTEGGATAHGAHGRDDEEHDLMHKITHIFHLISMSILSLLVLETLMKIFAMGCKFLHHKLEVFDAFVVIVSWSLDLAFRNGIWSSPGFEGATILIYLLPWRVVRVVNSFVLVIQEKDHVRLKLVKQLYRRSERRGRDTKQKLSKYRIETRSLQGLCRKHGIPDSAIYACLPEEKRRRQNSLAMTALSNFASLALVGAVGSVPDLTEKSEFSSDSSGDDDDDESSTGHRAADRTVSMDSMLSMASYSTDTTVSSQVNDNPAFLPETLRKPNMLPSYEDCVTLDETKAEEAKNTETLQTKL